MCEDCGVAGGTDIPDLEGLAVAVRAGLPKTGVDLSGRVIAGWTFVGCVLVGRVFVVCVEIDGGDFDLRSDGRVPFCTVLLVVLLSWWNLARTDNSDVGVEC